MNFGQGSYLSVLGMMVMNFTVGHIDHTDVMLVV